jgi:hypothetical protein
VLKKRISRILEFGELVKENIEILKTGSVNSVPVIF